MFAHRCSYKNSYFGELAYNSSVLVLIWRSAAYNSKRCSYHKNVVLLWILCFWFWSLPLPSCYLTSIVNKTHHGPVIVPFSVQLLQPFIYAGVVLISRLPTFFHCCWLIYFCYSANYNKRGAFVKIYLIHSDLLTCLRRVGTIVITIKQPQSHFDWAIIHKRHHFLLFWCILCTATPDIS